MQKNQYLNSSNNTAEVIEEGHFDARGKHIPLAKQGDKYKKDGTFASRYARAQAARELRAARKLKLKLSKNNQDFKDATGVDKANFNQTIDKGIINPAVWQTNKNIGIKPGVFGSAVSLGTAAIDTPAGLNPNLGVASHATGNHYNPTMVRNGMDTLYKTVRGGKDIYHSKETTINPRYLKSILPTAAAGGTILYGGTKLLGGIFGDDPDDMSDDDLKELLTDRGLQVQASPEGVPGDGGGGLGLGTTLAAGAGLAGAGVAGKHFYDRYKKDK